MSIQDLEQNIGAAGVDVDFQIQVEIDPDVEDIVKLDGVEAVSELTPELKKVGELMHAAVDDVLGLTKPGEGLIKLHRESNALIVSRDKILRSQSDLEPSKAKVIFQSLAFRLRSRSFVGIRVSPEDSESGLDSGIENAETPRD